MRGNEFVFDRVDLLYYKFHEIGLIHVRSYIDSSKWLKDKKSTINHKRYLKDKRYFLIKDIFNML